MIRQYGLHTAIRKNWKLGRRASKIRNIIKALEAVFIANKKVALLEEGLKDMLSERDTITDLDEHADPVKIYLLKGEEVTYTMSPYFQESSSSTRKCFLCNVLMENPDMHVNSRKHTQNFANIVLPPVIGTTYVREPIPQNKAINFVGTAFTSKRGRQNQIVPTKEEVKRIFMEPWSKENQYSLDLVLSQYYDLTKGNLCDRTVSDDNDFQIVDRRQTVEFSKTNGTRERLNQIGLDLGVGDGRMEDDGGLFVAPFFRAVTGVDHSAEICANLRRKISSVDWNLHFDVVKESVLHFARECTKKYDLILLSYIIIHMNDQAVKELFSYLTRILKTNGIIILKESLALKKDIFDHSDVTLQRTSSSIKSFISNSQFIVSDSEINIFTSDDGKITTGLWALMHAESRINKQLNFVKNKHRVISNNYPTDNLLDHRNRSAISGDINVGFMNKVANYLRRKQNCDVTKLTFCDLGSGNGLPSIGAAISGFRDVISIEIDPTCVDNSKRLLFELMSANLGFDGTSVRFCCNDITTWKELKTRRQVLMYSYNKGMPSTVVRSMLDILENSESCISYFISWINLEKPWNQIDLGLRKNVKLLKVFTNVKQTHGESPTMRLYEINKFKNDSLVRYRAPQFHGDICNDIARTTHEWIADDLFHPIEMQVSSNSSERKICKCFNQLKKLPVLSLSHYASIIKNRLVDSKPPKRRGSKFFSLDDLPNHSSLNTIDFWLDCAKANTGFPPLSPKEKEEFPDFFDGIDLKKCGKASIIMVDEIINWRIKLDEKCVSKCLRCLLPMEYCNKIITFDTLGKGSFGKVVQGFYPGSTKPLVALKSFSRFTSPKSFLDEYDILVQSLGAENVVQIQDVLKHNDRLSIVLGLLQPLSDELVKVLVESKMKFLNYIR